MNLKAKAGKVIAWALSAVMCVVMVLSGPSIKSNAETGDVIIYITTEHCTLYYSVDNEWSAENCVNNDTGSVLRDSTQPGFAFKIVPDSGYTLNSCKGSLIVPDSESPQDVDLSAGGIANSPEDFIGKDVGGAGIELNKTGEYRFSITAIVDEGPGGGGQGGEGGPGEPPAFDGNVYFFWNDPDHGTCYMLFTELKESSSGEINIFDVETANLTGKDASGNSVVFTWSNGNIPKHEWVSTDSFGFQCGPGNEVPLSDNILWHMFDGTRPKEDYQDNGVTIQPGPSEYGDNSFTETPDNMFRVKFVIGGEYEGIKLDTSALAHVPEFIDSLVKVTDFEIANSSENNPAEIETYVLEDKITIAGSEGSRGAYASVEALDVPDGAVSVQKIGGAFEITFNSNFFDKVVFKIQDEYGADYYVQIIRTALELHDRDGNLAVADFYFTEGSYTDYEAIATIIYEDGSYESVKCGRTSMIDKWGNDWGIQHNNAAAGGQPGVKATSFAVPITDNMGGVSFTIIKAGATDGDTYAGTIAGSGAGALYEISKG